MTSVACVICHANTNAQLCNRHTDDLLIALGELPAWINELTVTVTGQSKTSTGDSSKPTKKFEQPMPYNDTAAELLTHVRNELGSWVRHLCESRGAPIPRLTRPQAMARFLHTNIDSIRMDEACGEMFTALTAMRDAIKHQVDNAGRRWAGPCTATVVERDLSVIVEGERLVVKVSDGTDGARKCGADLRTRSGAKKITCPACGTVYDPVERAAWILAQARDHMDTAAFIAYALTDAGRKVQRNTITQWARRGKLFAWRESDVGEPLYRIGDVIALLDEMTPHQRGSMSA